MAKKDDELNVGTESVRAESKREKNAEEESTGSKIVTILIVVLIILIWLGAFIFAIKLDFLGFGSKVLTPVLKDVPVVNKILPDANSTDPYGEGTVGEYDFDNVEEAVERIKELEMQLDSQSSSSGVDSNYIQELEAEINRLKKFEDQQEEFAQQKKEFDEEVVYADAAPNISEYQKYYEQIDPDNAAEIYRQVVEQVEYDKKVEEEAKKYASMEPAAAAATLDVMASADLDLVCAILSSMDTEASALIMNELDANVNAKITKRGLSKD